MASAHIPSTAYSVDEDGFLRDSSGGVLGNAYSDLAASGQLPEQEELKLTKLNLISVTGFISAIEMIGSDSTVVGYLFSDDYEAETGECVDGGNCILSVATWTFSSGTFDYIISGRSDAIVTAGDIRDRVPAARKYRVTLHDDDLVEIAQNLFRDGRRWRELYALNRNMLNEEAESRGLPPNNPKSIFPGMILKVPRR